MEGTTATDPTLTFEAAMAAQMAVVAAELGHWARAAPRTLEEVERQALAAAQGLGHALLAGVCEILAAPPAAPEHPCACGHAARYLRHRPAAVRTVLGPVTIDRAYYHCARCRHGHAPLDRQLGYCAGSTSAGLDEVLALLGATADSFAEATALLDKLTLVRVSPNLARAATEGLGRAVQAAQQRTRAAAWDRGALPPAVAAPGRLYLSMDGVLVHTDAGWREYKLGAVYTTAARPARDRPGETDLRAQELSFVGDVADAATFGELLWCEAARRGALAAGEVVVVADGAHWIWDLVAQHFPAATQIVDWYHASGYVWRAAHAVYGEGTPLARRWAKRRLDDLWAGRVAKVLTALAAHRARGEAVEEALTYYTNHQHRMRYDEYRARGLQVGSGSIESGCKQVITARLKQAGMVWSLDGARAVAAARTWLKSGRWAEATAVQPPRRRTYHRKAA